MSACKFTSTTTPRILPGRHLDECGGDCTGCQPCTEPHCRVCARTHTEHACPECVGATRDDLHTILAMYGNLPAEVVHRGINGEAMTLLGPAANPEAWGHHQASAEAGRIPWDELEAGSDHHPATALGTWAMVYRDAFEHDEPTARVTVVSEGDYLDRNLTEASTWPHVPFEDFVHDLRRCRAHMESVLHDGEQRDTGAPCMTCGVPLERVWGKGEKLDGWRCPKCRQSSTEDQYRFAVAHLHREEATHLTAADMEIRTGVKSGTVKVWAHRGMIERRADSGRTVYSVADVMARCQ